MAENETMADWAWNKDGKLVCRSGFASPVNGLGREAWDAAVSKYGHLGYFHKGGGVFEHTHTKAQVRVYRTSSGGTGVSVC